MVHFAIFLTSSFAVPKFFLMGFNEDETVKFCIVEKNKLRVAESEDCTTGSLVNVKWQDNNEYQGKIFGMSGT